MPVVGMKLDKMEGNKNKEVSGEIKINSTPKIIDVKEMEIPTFGKKVLSLGFEFSTVYEPKIGEISLKGEVLYLADNNQKVLKQWKEKKILPEDMNVEVLNYLFRQCLLKIANIAYDLQLPPPISMPVVRPKQEESNYVG